MVTVTAWGEHCEIFTHTNSGDSLTKRWPNFLPEYTWIFQLKVCIHNQKASPASVVFALIVASIWSMFDLIHKNPSGVMPWYFTLLFIYTDYPQPQIGKVWVSYSGVPRPHRLFHDLHLNLEIHGFLSGPFFIGYVGKICVCQSLGELTGNQPLF